MKNAILRITLSAAIVMIASIFCTDAAADMVQFHNNAYWGTMGGVGSGRGIGFRADTDFPISSIGIYGALNAMTHEVVIYSSTDGNQANTLLKSASAAFSTGGLSWNDISIDYTFQAGNYYTIGWRPAVSTSGWASSITYYDDQSGHLPFSNGVATLINGTEGWDMSGFSNFLHPQLRVDVVPVPGAVLLGILGLGAVGVKVRKFT